MFNFRIDKILWKKVRVAVKDNPKYFSISQFLRDSIREKLIREADNG